MVTKARKAYGASGRLWCISAALAAPFLIFNHPSIISSPTNSAIRYESPSTISPFRTPTYDEPHSPPAHRICICVCVSFVPDPTSSVFVEASVHRKQHLLTASTVSPSSSTIDYFPAPLFPHNRGTLHYPDDYPHFRIESVDGLALVDTLHIVDFVACKDAARRGAGQNKSRLLLSKQHRQGSLPDPLPPVPSCPSSDWPERHF